MSAADRPNQYFSEQYIATSSVGRIAVDFGFVANQVIVFNDKAASVYESLDTTTGSTGGWRIKANESLTLQGLVGGVALSTTATSTTDTVRIGAWRF